MGPKEFLLTVWLDEGTLNLRADTWIEQLESPLAEERRASP